VDNKEVVRELMRRLDEGDTSAIDEFMAEDMVNHAAGPQGREGWKQIATIIGDDLGPTVREHHQIFGEGDLVAHRMTIKGKHSDSTMPLFNGLPVSGAPVAWDFIHIWRVVDGQIVEHWACRDDVGLLRQVGAWPSR
jgi:lactoylglutathione lyase